MDRSRGNLDWSKMRRDRPNRNPQPQPTLAKLLQPTEPQKFLHRPTPLGTISHHRLNLHFPEFLPRTIALRSRLDGRRFPLLDTYRNLHPQQYSPPNLTATTEAIATITFTLTWFESAQFTHIAWWSLSAAVPSDAKN
ncbi:MAG: hypothetical protein SXA11_20935 [Cyanobacteriota bacterium]|nr:hypothetical protein [Cyanobacteriota bacterium]